MIEPAWLIFERIGRGSMYKPGDVNRLVEAPTANSVAAHSKSIERAALLRISEVRMHPSAVNSKQKRTVSHGKASGRLL